MKIDHLLPALMLVCFGSVCIAAQQPILINDPTVTTAEAKLTAVEQSILDKSVLPAARAKLASDTCPEEVTAGGVVQGAFTRAGARQTLIFYQFCITGNGMGAAGVAVIEDGSLVGSFVAAEAGYTVDAKVLPDINQNGVNEIALYYSGGMHQGEGGTGVDIVEVDRGTLKGIGWYQADGFTADGTSTGYKVMARAGKTPVFFREKYVKSEGGKWRKVGTQVPLKLTAVTSTFEKLK